MMRFMPLKRITSCNWWRAFVDAAELRHEHPYLIALLQKALGELAGGLGHSSEPSMKGWMHWEMVRTFAFFKLMFGNAGIKGTKV
jgi:hypothetical protein